MAFDTASITGWASGVTSPGSGWDPDVRKTYVSGVEDFRSDEENNRLGNMFFKFRMEVSEILRVERPELVVYERIVGGVHAGGNTSLIQKGLESHLLAACYSYSIRLPVLSVSAGSIKKWATGSGKLTHDSKKLLVERAVETFGIDGLIKRNPTKSKPWDYDDNQCDALWLLDLMASVVSEFGVPNQDNVTNMINEVTKNRTSKS